MRRKPPPAGSADGLVLRSPLGCRAGPPSRSFPVPTLLDRLADLVPPPRKHRHRYHGVFAPNHKLRPAVTSLALGNIAKRGEAGACGHAGNTHATGCCDTQAKPRSHDTSRIAWAKLMARVGEGFPLECPNCGGDIRLRADRRQDPAHFEGRVKASGKSPRRPYGHGGMLDACGSAIVRAFLQPLVPTKIVFQLPPVGCVRAFTTSTAKPASSKRATNR
jgi:hypothetical protein